ncbi:hypothetical protein CAter10_2521 [Collimonas arenae]|uniref:hypothetical protein n=1 Tax=Collimonas arenae TaxID=279058 RepID=UPI000778474D|nr:hypothetical protein [Collimonas arenae]AMP00167.1 hypothetical protein CAter10_2521 [Collimonas arenae]
MKDILAGVLLALNSIEDNYQVRDEGLVNFRMQKVELQKLIDAPDTAPATVVQTVVADGKLDAIAASVASLQDAVAKLISNTAPAPFAPAVPVPGASNPAL